MTARRSFSLPEATGIGGLLLFFVITQFITIALHVSTTPSFLAAFQPVEWELAGRVRFYQTFVVIEAVAHVLRIAGPIVGLVMIFRHDPRTRTFYTIYLLSVAAFGAFEWVGITLTFPQLEPLLVAAGRSLDEARQARLDAFMGAIRTCGYGSIWLWYWRESSRVANTFRRAGPAENAIG